MLRLPAGGRQCGYFPGAQDGTCRFGPPGRRKVTGSTTAPWSRAIFRARGSASEQRGEAQTAVKAATGDARTFQKSHQDRQDGQDNTTWLRDIGPGRRWRIVAHLRSGRMSIGPGLCRSLLNKGQYSARNRLIKRQHLVALEAYGQRRLGSVKRARVAMLYPKERDRMAG